MDYAALAVEIALPAYEGLSDAEIAASLNAKTVAVRRVVPIVDITTYLRSEGAWLGIVAAASTNPAAAAAVDYNGDLRAVNIDLDLPLVGQMLAALVQSSLLTQAQADALDAMADATVSRADQLGLGTVAPGDVTTARSY